MRALRRFGLVLLALGLALSTWAMSPGARGVEIRMRYSRFEPGIVSVAAGVPVTFVLRNDDPIDHEWIVGDEAVQRRHRTGTEPHHGQRPTEQSVPALSEVRTTVTFDRAGTYRVICHMPGHEAFGMVGTVTVTGP